MSIVTSLGFISGIPAAINTYFAKGKTHSGPGLFLANHGFWAAALPETVYFSRGSVAMARLLAVIQRRPAASSIQNARGDRPASVQGELRLHGVTFAYPTRPALPVLKRHTRPYQADPACVHDSVLLLDRNCLHSMPYPAMQGF